MRLSIIIMGFLFLFSCDVKQNTIEEPVTEAVQELPRLKNSKAKNIILLIGDGMGMGQISAGTYSNNNTSHLERFPVIGLHKPQSSNDLITDSAAAATSFACGVKTFNKAIGMNADSIPVQTILEEAESLGLKTGLVATSTIVHATPASFIAHNNSRRDYEGIAEDFLKTDIDYFVGGGKKFFDRREKDERNLIEELTAKGYHMENYLIDFADIKSSINTHDKFGYLTADNDPLPVSKGRDYFVDASMAGIHFLKQKSNDGFFIMIESSQIDWGGHANKAEYIITEFLEFNTLIGEVLDWAEADGETLVVLTADHETGGFTIQPGSTMDTLKTAFTSTKHSGDFIPVFSYGPQSENFAGMYENTEIYFKMRAALGWAAK